MQALNVNSLSNEEGFELCRAIIRLKMDDNFNLLISLLEKDMGKFDKDNRILTSPDMEWSQGASQYLDSFLKLIRESDSLSKTFRDNHESQKIQNT